VQYTIATEQIGPRLTKIMVTVTGDQGEIILDGQTAGVTSVGTADQAVAHEYAENVFLPDLRANDDRLAGLVLPCDTPPEPAPQDPPAEPGV
jgi:hypothetical protein